MIIYSFYLNWANQFDYLVETFFSDIDSNVEAFKHKYEVFENKNTVLFYVAFEESPDSERMTVLNKSLFQNKKQDRNPMIIESFYEEPHDSNGILLGRINYSETTKRLYAGLVNEVLFLEKNFDFNVALQALTMWGIYKHIGAENE